MNFYNFLVLLLIQLQAGLNDEKSEELEDEGVAGAEQEIQILSTLEQVWPSHTFPSYRPPIEVIRDISRLYGIGAPIICRFFL